MRASSIYEVYSLVYFRDSCTSTTQTEKCTTQKTQTPKHVLVVKANSSSAACAVADVVWLSGLYYCTHISSAYFYLLYTHTHLCTTKHILVHIVIIICRLIYSTSFIFFFSTIIFPRISIKLVKTHGIFTTICTVQYTYTTI